MAQATFKSSARRPNLVVVGNSLIGQLWELHRPEILKSNQNARVTAYASDGNRVVRLLVCLYHGTKPRKRQLFKPTFLRATTLRYAFNDHPSRSRCSVPTNFQPWKWEMISGLVSPPQVLVGSLVMEPSRLPPLHKFLP